LRLFLSLAAAGWNGYSEHVERSIHLASMLERELLARGFSVANQSPLAVLCINPPPSFGPVRAMVDRVLADGRAWVAATMFEGREVIRACVTHGETSPADVRELALALTAAGSVHAETE
jgi:glutamate/tyrosine decarboxylase-like PLP-dependent enzyme